MLMKNIFIAILMSLAILPSMATLVNVRTKSTLPRGGARMPSITQVRADYEDGILTVNIQRYFGRVCFLEKGIPYEVCDIDKDCLVKLLEIYYESKDEK